jgi:hypothetical protein
VRRLAGPPKLVVRRRDGWLGYVRYAVSPGLRYFEWVIAELVREA